MSDDGRMPPRYGFDVNGYARQMHDGYWTPWHIAKDEITALRAALDQERADNERLRACMDELRQGALHMPMTVDRIDVIECLHAHGMCETDGVPTALLSGRDETAT